MLLLLLEYYSESKPQLLKHMSYSVTFVRSRSTYGIDVAADGRITALCDEDHRRYHLSVTPPTDRVVLSPSTVDLFYQRQMMYVVSREQACLFVYRGSFPVDALEHPPPPSIDNTTTNATSSVIRTNISTSEDEEAHLKKATRIFRRIQSQIESSLVKRNISTIASLQLMMKGAMKKKYKQKQQLQLSVGKSDTATTPHTFPLHRRDIKQPYWRPYVDATRLQDVIKSVFQ